MPKAGSTALQQSLAASRDALGRRGILYPRAPIFADSQNFLIAGLEERRHALPRMIRAAYDGRMDRIAPEFAKWTAGMRSAVEASRPETLVLSSEWLFGLRGSSKFDRLGRLLRDLGGSIAVVAYVRRPSDQYLSTVQQTLKGSHAIRPATAIRYRTPLEGFARIADTIHVVRYDRDAFPGGDIVRHFLAAFVPDAVDLVPAGGAREANATISAEGMAILAGYRRVNHPRRRGRFTPDTDRVIAAIREADRAVGGALRPRLLEPVRAAIDHGSEDVLWLRDAYGIVFDGIDYSRITPAPPAPDRKKKKDRPAGIEAICEVDPERRQEMLMRILHALAAGTDARPAARWGGLSRLLGGGGGSAKH